MKQTVQFAFGVAAFKSILPKVVQMFKNPIKVPRNFLRHFDYKFFMFFISMNGIFKVCNDIEVYRFRAVALFRLLNGFL